MASLLQEYLKWLDTDSEIDLVLTFPFFSPEDLIKGASEKVNIRNIYCTIPNIVTLYKDTYTKLKPYKNDSLTIPTYIYADFSQTSEPNIGAPGSDGGLNPEGKLRTLPYLFKNVFWKRKVVSFFIYNFSGKKPINDYWIANPTNYTNFFICNRSIWAVMAQGVPKRSGNKSPSDDPQWRNELKLYLRYIFSFIVEPQYVEEFIDEKYFNIWVRAFTHYTYNLLYNYEPLEYYGDAVAKFVFNQYMELKYPRFTNNELSEYFHQYMSKEYQSIFSDDLQLQSWGLYDPLVFSNDKLKTDILEAFTGSMAKIGDMISRGIGTEVCLNFYTILGESLSFPESMAYGDVFTQVQQIDEMLGFTNNTNPLNGNNLFIDGNKEKAFVLFENDIKSGANTQKETRIEFNPKFFIILEKKGIAVQKINSLRQFFGPQWFHLQRFDNQVKESKEDARRIIYTQLYENYIKAGVTREFASQGKNQFKNINEDLLRALKNAVGEDQYNRIKFFTENDIGIIIMYVDIYDSSSNQSGDKSLSFQIEKQSSNPNTKNLFVGKFYSSVPAGTSLTTLEYSKEEAIRKFLFDNQTKTVKF